MSRQSVGSCFIPWPFARGAGGTNLPHSGDGQNGRANWDLGFPEITAMPISEGGIPPHYMDFQNVLHAITEHTCFAQAGGLYPWNTSCAYEKGARVFYNGDAWQANADISAGAAAPGGNSNWTKTGVPDGSTITVSGGKMSVAGAATAKALAPQLADGTTISAYVSGGAYTGKLGIISAGVASAVQGDGLSVSGGKLKVTKAGVTDAALTVKGGASSISFTGAAARAVNISGGAGVTVTGAIAGGSALNITVGLNASAVIPTGTQMLFYQNAAPAGWTRIANNTLHDAAIRVVASGFSGANAGGTVQNSAAKGFSALFAASFSAALTGGNTGAHVLSVQEIPSHSHRIRAFAVAKYGGPSCVDCGDWGEDGRHDVQTYGAGGGKGHSHPLSGGSVKFSLDVKRAQVIVCSKNAI